MNRHSDDEPDLDSQRQKIIGLGELSIRKSYYPELQQRQEALKESEARLKSILHAMPVMQFVLDRNHRVISWNRAIETYSGIKAEDVLGTDGQWRAFYMEKRPLLADLILSQAFDQLPAWYPEKFSRSRFVEDGYEVTDFFPHMGAGGKWLHATAVPIRDAKGDITGAIETLEDITERMRTENALQLARNKISLLNTVTFQDIQTAAFSLSAYYELLRTLVTDERTRAFLEKQVSANQKIIDSLNFAKNYQEMGVRPPRWQDVGQVFLFAISHLDLSKITRNIHVEGLEVYADPLLEKVFFHLMQNVIRYGEHATEVTITSRENPDGLLLIIQDNGVGIPAEEKQMVFDRGHGKNAGLGLFLVREVLSITGITIRETGVPGKGARFEMAIPKGSYRFVPKG